MLTSDQIVVDGARYELVLTSPGKVPITLHVSSESFAILLRTWKELERRSGARLDAGAFLRVLVLHALDARHRKATIHQRPHVSTIP